MLVESVLTENAAVVAVIVMSFTGINYSLCNCKAKVICFYHSVQSFVCIVFGCCFVTSIFFSSILCRSVF